MKRRLFLFFSCQFAFFLFIGCSPKVSGKGSLQDDILYREMRIEIDDLHRKSDHMKAEAQIIEEKLKDQMDVLASLQKEWRESNSVEREEIKKKIASLEELLALAMKKQESVLLDLRRLTDHANDTTSLLAQHKGRLEKFEGDVKEKFSVMKKSVASLIHFVEGRAGSKKKHTVKEGDSLERIARLYNTTVEDLKKINHLDSDMIVIGKELKLP